MQSENSNILEVDVLNIDNNKENLCVSVEDIIKYYYIPL